MGNLIFYIELIELCDPSLLFKVDKNVVYFSFFAKFKKSFLYVMLN